MKKTFSAMAIMALLLIHLNLISVIQTDTPEDILPFFSVHLLAPTSNPGRMQAAQLITEELPKISIDVERSLVSWAVIGPRSYYTKVGPYIDGGCDMVLFGLSLGSSACRKEAYFAGIQAAFRAESIQLISFNHF
ncbi:MAG: hypothetical protein ACW98A_14950 [Candidatus Hodarchaeales archaeon]|jgi:hypothetical protein